MSKRGKQNKKDETPPLEGKEEQIDDELDAIKLT